MDHVLPEVALRQWVLSLPQPLRYLCAYDTSLCSALNLNLHYHTLVPDGVFVTEGEHSDSLPRFVALSAPSDADIMEVAWETCLGVVDILRQRGQWLDDD